MPCPVDTGLTPIAICGSIQAVCDAGEPQDLRVAVTLLAPPDGAVLRDPSNDALVVTGVIEDTVIEASTDGCWSTCELLPNFDSSGAGGALSPNTTGYRIQVLWGRTTVVDEIVQLDAAGAYAVDNINGEDCVNITTLLGAPVELPAPATFCEMVQDCLPDETISTLVPNADGVSWTYTNEAGVVTVVDPDVSTLTDNGDGTWTHTAGGVDTDITTTVVTDNLDGSFTAANANGVNVTWTIPVDTDTNTSMSAVQTSPGVFTFTNQDGTPGVVIDVNDVIVSADTGNVLIAGTDTGAYLSCEAIQDCVGTALAAVDGITYDDAGNAITVTIVDSNGVPLVPNADGTYQLPASTSDVGQAVVTTDAVTGAVTIEGTDTAGVVTTATIPAPVVEQGEATITPGTGAALNTTTIEGVQTDGTVTTDTVINNLFDCAGNNLDVATAQLLDLTEPKAATAVNLDAALPHKLLGLDENGDCIAFDLTCAPGDHDGTIKIAGLEFEAYNRAIRHLYVNEAGHVNQEVFNDTNIVGDSFTFDGTDSATDGCITFTVDTCSQNKMVSFNGDHSYTIVGTQVNELDDNVQISIQYSLDGGAWVTMGTAGQIRVYKPAGIPQTEYQYSTHDSILMSEGTHTMCFRWTINNNPFETGIRMIAQNSGVIIDQGPGIRCC